jgi:hypothetical protein
MKNMKALGFCGTAIAVGLAAMAVAAPAEAQSTGSVRVRGTIEGIDGDILHVRTRGGSDAAIRIAGDIRVTGLIKASRSDIKPGAYIGTAAIEQAPGQVKALEIQVFPENMRGSGEGDHPYDLGPKSTMTNGTIGQVIDASGGQQVTIKYQGAEKTVAVPADTPVVTYAAATRDDLAAGAKVIVNAIKQPDGTFQTSRILVGKDGLEPPM